MIHTGVVAGVNRVRDFALMLNEDGTKVRHQVLPQGPDRSVRPMAVLSVNRLTKDGFEPLENGSIRGSSAAWEGFSSGSLGDRRSFVEVALPGAFENPEQLAVDAYWFQPELNDVNGLALDISLASRFVEGVDWSLLSTITKSTTTGPEMSPRIPRSKPKPNSWFASSPLCRRITNTCQSKSRPSSTD
jgi:hypothetical protein